ncbi:uncharacterized protein LOC112164526 isoform X1 [Rosa chinensis]|uniref:uncharacterized protein LOC112164526 isoform X1 n=1 Tax=Rosa chinensis TaxID=74649 RepID=UPI000D0919ED|nr:uncharacterized protein LOC112164526 isoform X1 [Rosa chinensis]
MSPALLESRAPAHHPNLNTGQISHPPFSLFNFSEYKFEMNPSNASDVSSGFGNSSHDFSFNSSSPSRQGSGLARPRLLKVRKGLINPQLSRPSAETGAPPPGFNPFGNSVSGEFRSDSDSNLNPGIGVADQMSNLKIIGSGSEFGDAKDAAGFHFDTRLSSSSTSAGRLDGGGFVFGSEFFKSSGFDDGIASKLPEDMRKLNIEGPGNGGAVEKGEDRRFHGSANTLTGFGLGSNDNVGGSLGRNVGSELPHELEKKLNINENVQMGGRTDTHNADGVNKFVFNTSKKDDYSSAGSSVNALPDKMKNLNIGLSFDGRKESLLLRKMETLDIGTKAGLSTQSDTGTSSRQTSVKNMETEREDEFNFTSKQDHLSTSSVEFKTPNTKANLFSGINKKLEFNAKREPARARPARDTRMKKASGKLRRPTSSQLGLGHDVVSKGGSPVNVEAFESYSPMDISPYQETLADHQYSKENSASSESFSLVNDYLETDSFPKVTNNSIDEDLAMATECLDINKVDAVSRPPQEEAFEYHLGGSVNADEPVEGSVSGAETESFKSATDEVDYISDTANSAETEVSSSPNMERHDTDGRIHFGFHASSSNRSGLSFTFAASTAAQCPLSPSKRLHKKKNIVKAGQDANSFVPNAKVPYGSSSAEFLPYSGAPVRSTPGHYQEINPPISVISQRNEDNSGVQKEQEIKQEAVSLSAETAAAQEACEKWRLRGNQAYSNGDLSKAEDCYTQGVNGVSENETSTSCLRALMLCYSNRAATRMALGRIRDALGDCMMAAAIDPNFLKVQVRAANCYLTLGEVQDASQHFRRCLQLASDVCVDQKIVVEASDGLQKAQKVSECLNLCAELVQRKTSTNAESALELIAEALAISPSSEKLFEMKAEALFTMRRYDEVIELCEKTLGYAEKNSPLVDTAISLDGSELSKYLHFRLWRCRLTFKSYFHLGKLEEGLASLEKQEEKVSTTYRTSRNWRKTLESSIPLVCIVRELLSYKVAGNEAFQAGRHTEAVERYTTALSCNAESRPFAAVCFCNRAAAYKALGQITDAIADCSLAIALDGSYLKAISRRATLYEMIRDYGQAAKDLHRLVSLLTKQLEENINQCGTSDISNSCKSDLKQVRLRLSEIEEEARKDIPLDMYIILGIKPSISASEIKKAYRKAALRHHPDKAVQFFARSETGDDGLWKEIAEEAHKDADRLFKIIGEAYAVLSDSTKRARYDAEEETRNAQKKRTGSSAARMPADAQNYPYERSGSSRQWR